MSRHTLGISTADAVQRGLAREIVGRLKRQGLRLVAAERRVVAPRPRTPPAPSARQPSRCSADLDDPSSPAVPALLLVVEGPEDTWEVVRTLIGATNPRDAAPGTIRGDLGILLTENLVHRSDSPTQPSRRSRSSSHKLWTAVPCRAHASPLASLPAATPSRRHPRMSDNLFSIHRP